MNILYVGAESANWVIMLCNEFCKKGHTVTCIVQQEDEYDKEHPVKEHPNLKRINLPFNTVINNRQELINRISYVLLQEKFDIIFGSHTPICPAIQIVSKIFSIPCGIMILDIPTDLIKIQEWRQKCWDVWFKYLKKCDIIITNTMEARSELSKFTNIELPDENVIPYAVNLEEGYDNAGIDIKGDYVITICRLTAMKNCIAIPKALSLLDTKLKYVAIGRNSGQIGGGQLDIIKKYCEDHNIGFTHYNMVTEEQKYELIKNSSILIYPQDSKYIAGLTPFEAMYCGKPAIVKNYPILTNLYNKHVSYFDTIYDLATQISVIHNFKRELLKENLITANQYMKKIATFPIMAERLLKIFEKVKK